MNRFKLLVATWNVGNAAPPSDLSEWLGVCQADFDLVVVGAQEVPSQFKQGTDRRKEIATVRRKAGGLTHSGPLGKVLGKVGIGSTTPSEGSGSNTPAEGSGVGCVAGSGATAALRAAVESLVEESMSSDDDQASEPAETPLLSASPRGFKGAGGVSMAKTVGRALKRDKAYRGEEFAAIDARGSPIFQQRRYSKPNTASTPPSGFLGSIETTYDCTDSDRHDEQNTGRAPSWGMRLEKALGEEFVKVEKKAMFGIRLHVFVRRRFQKRVTVLSCLSEGTGVANVVGNKGAVAIKIALDDTVFTFVSCHLAAHEGVKHLAQRNQDVVEILKNLEPISNGKSVPSTLRSHHIFWLGDLNYRLDLSRARHDATNWTAHEKFQYVNDMVEKQEYKSLIACDELSREISQLSGVFRGFQEGALSFPPTFKLLRDEEGYCYDSERLPSYCDRILWHSIGNQRFHVKFDHYRAFPRITTSDHKPIHAAFTLQVPTMPKPIEFQTDVMHLALEFRSIEAFGFWKGTSRKSGQGEMSRGESFSQFQASAKKHIGDFTKAAEHMTHLHPHDHTDDGGESNQAPTRKVSRRAGLVQLLDWSFAPFLGVDTDPKLLVSPLFQSPNSVSPDTVMEARPESSSSSDLLFGGPVPLRPVRSPGELNHKHISLAFSRALAGPTGKLLPAANLQFSDITSVPVGSLQKLKVPVFWLGQPHGVVNCEVRLVFSDRWAYIAP